MNKKRTSFHNYYWKKKDKKQTLAINCKLNGPDICNALATEKQIPWIFSIVLSLRSCGGVTKVASPEWTPAFSTCSEIA